MNEILTDKMLQEIFAALAKGETYSYSDGNTAIQVGPNGMSIKYNSAIKKPDKDVEVKRFLAFCDNLHDDLFVEVCESFSDGELAKLQNDLDTDNYRNTIKVFTTRAKEIANNNLAQIVNDADVEIRRNEEQIRIAQRNIQELHKCLEEAHAKYSI